MRTSKLILMQRRILREQEQKLYIAHLMLCLGTEKKALTPDEWKKLSFDEKAVASGRIKEEDKK